MRVTAETKAATKRQILQASRRLFAENGFDSTTTRDIALAAGTATGTLFNYFPTKDAIVACMAAEALDGTIEEVLSDANEFETWNEALFALIAATLRKLKPFRKYLPSLLGALQSQIADAAEPQVAALRSNHLTAVASLGARYGHPKLPAVASHLYWTLYVGVLVFWASDKSPKQEDTLALIDQSLDMFVEWVRSSTD